MKSNTTKFNRPCGGRKPVGHLISLGGTLDSMDPHPGFSQWPESNDDPILDGYNKDKGGV